MAAGIIHFVMHPRETPVELTPGDLAPEFELAGSDGRTYRLKDLAGHPVVLAWFPKAFTGG
jgi:peroxiredoxin